ncbi:hypothetical protein ACFL6U_18445 [Planctomycetota bacterium]
MLHEDERRMESRYRYHWPVWFAPDMQGEVTQGQMVDVTSVAAAFTCYADHQCPHPSQHLATRFSVPTYGEDDSFDMQDFIRTGHVYRVDRVSDQLRRVVVQFHEPLPFHPGEQAHEEAQVAQAEPVLV